MAAGGKNERARTEAGIAAASRQGAKRFDL
jgi:hypothetical protein